jgi:hypothetical protein
MRVIGEVAHPGCKITLFSWNQKFLIKIEQGACEQTFKIPQLEIGTEAELRSMLSSAFIDSALARFVTFHQELA